MLPNPNQPPQRPTGIAQSMSQLGNAIFSGTPKLMIWLLRLVFYLFMFFVLGVIVGSAIPFGLLILRWAWNFYNGG